MSVALHTSANHKVPLPGAVSSFLSLQLYNFRSIPDFPGVSADFSNAGHKLIFK